MGNKNSKQAEQNPNVKIKKFHLDKEEIQGIQAIQATEQMIAVMREGCSNSMYVRVARARKRLGLDTPESMKAPDGWERTIDFDPNSYEILVVDQKIPEKVDIPVKGTNMPKN